MVRKKTGIMLMLAAISIIIFCLFFGTKKQEGISSPFDTGTLLFFAGLFFLIGMLVFLFSNKGKEKKEWLDN